MRRITGIMVVVLALIVGAASRAEAGIIVDHPPMFNGPSADTEFVTLFGDPYWQLLADDFTLPTSATVAHVKWWGFYGNIGGGGGSQILPPAGDEVMRIRFYDDTGDNGVPGSMLYEESFLNPTRVSTGRTVDFTTGAREYEFDVDLTTPFSASASTRYWMEIVQVGSPQSVFRWEFSNAPGDTIAGINPDVSGWTYRNGVNLAFQLSDVPEPSTIATLFIALAFSSRQKRRRLVSSRYRSGFDSASSHGWGTRCRKEAPHGPLFSRIQTSKTTHSNERRKGH
ncbi:MAG: PEP-CTERM sorting domain-containing protein [Planctomycetes bacterium]|nr:PEP-CTERM sorting domain-containing protein [Planctomycetota bacterium]